MAQPSATRTSPHTDGETETVPNHRGEGAETVPLDDSSIERLLAATDEGWDIDDHRLTLKIAADERPLGGTPGGAGGEIPSRQPTLRLPAPFELAPTQFGVVTTPKPETASQPPSKPPPLPTTSRSKQPPPVPTPGRSKHPPPMPKPDVPSVRPPRSVDPLSPTSLVDLLNARIATLEGGDDKVGLARAHMELAVASEVVLADEARALLHAEVALKVDPHFAAAHAMLRRRKHGRAALAAMVAHLDHEIAAATDEANAVDLLVEKARLLEASDREDEARGAFELALARAPRHPAALKGLEGALRKRARVGVGADGAQPGHEALAMHLAQMADAYASDPKLAAWLHVERARILEYELRRDDVARGAYERALELDPGVGPVRSAVVRHIDAHRDAATLASLLEQEAELESDPARAARLELDAALLVSMRLGDGARAATLLEKAAGRAPTSHAVDLRVLDELVRLREAASEWALADRARRARLRFVGDPAALAHELRALAVIAERQGDIPQAIADIQRAMAASPADASLVEMLDRLLTHAEKHDARVQLWVTEAARNDDGIKRARALSRAAQIAEVALGRPDEAIRHLRAAWVSAPGDSEVLDALSRLLSPSPSESALAEARALVELYTQAAEHTRDPVRRVAYFEKAAVLYEEVLAEPQHAARAFESILKLEPDRRGAVLGLARAASRLGDERTLARALLEEARLSDDGVVQLALKTRAAATLAKFDAARALSLVTEVLEHDPAHTAARALETRLHEDAGRWERAAESLAARIDIATQPAEKLALHLALAQVHETRLRKPADAIQQLKAARAIDPAHPVPPEAIARVLEATGDWSGLRAAFESLAGSAKTNEERARHLVRAAELDELKLGDDLQAARTYARALAEMPDDERIAERLTRVLLRYGAAERKAHGVRGASAYGELATLYTRRIDQAALPEVSRALSFELAALLSEIDSDLPRAARLLEDVLADEPHHAGALRTLEAVGWKLGEPEAVARTLSRQGEAFFDESARIGALASLASMEEWRLPASDPLTTYRRLLALAPNHAAALEAVARRELPNARRGDAHARKEVIAALRSLTAQTSDAGTQLAMQLRLALLLEHASTEGFESTPNAAGREALDRYRDALHRDPLSVTAATGLARISHRLHDAEAAIAAAMALTELTVDARVRARYLLDAADLLVTTDDDDARLGGRKQRRARAVGLLERALDADPDSIPAAGRLATILLEDREPARLVDAFRAVLSRAQSADAIVMLGSEIARVARDELKELSVAIESMRRVREVAPQHIPSLLTLAELCIAQRAWAEAVEALESVVAMSHDAGPRLTALFALASIYGRVLHRYEDTERALRAALSIDPKNARALRALLRHLAHPPKNEDPPRAPDKAELADLLERLAGVEKDTTQRALIYAELAEMRSALGDRAAAELCLIEAVALAPTNAKAFAKLSALHKTPPRDPRDGRDGRDGRDAVGYARSLAAVIARGQQLGHVDARWFAALGQLEVEALSRTREGIAHLQRAIQLDPTLHESRFELANAFSRLNAHEDATRVILGMITPSTTPLTHIADPAAALLLLERSFTAERKAEEALVVSELRAVAGDLDDGRHAWLRARRLGPVEPHHVVLDRPTIVTHILPADGRHILLEVAAAVAGIESKMLRADLSELGLTSRDRITARSGHPTRALVDRVARALGLSDFELAVTPNVTRTRVVAQDVPWIVFPQALTQRPEPQQLVSLARALARIAMGVPWLEELPPAHVEAFLVAAARQVLPAYAGEHLDVLSAKLVTQYEPLVAKHVARRQRKVLEELVPHIAAPQGLPPAVETFMHALSRAELRVAYVLTGDLLAAFDELASLDPGLARPLANPSRATLVATLEHPYAADVVRFALGPEAVALRRRVGAVWT
jgi:tetratricopeptide (TPR) repeat protein